MDLPTLLKRKMLEKVSASRVKRYQWKEFILIGCMVTEIHVFDQKNTQRLPNQHLFDISVKYKMS